MKRTLFAATAMTTVICSAASAENIGMSMALFDDNWLTVLRNGTTAYVAGLDGVDIQVENAQNDVAKQLDQVKNFIAQGVDAIIVNPVDTSSTQAMTNEAEAAGVPLVFVNRKPVNLDTLPDNQAVVASDEAESGTLEAFEVCKELRAQGKNAGARIYIMMGELQTQSAVQRTKDVHDVIGMDMCNFITVVDEQTANYQRGEAQDLMTNWLSAGEPFDAVISNNDEMAIGAIQAMKAAGIPMDDVIVAGVDATQDALLSMASGELDVTVFQDAVGQGTGAVDAALALARGEEVDRVVWIPFQLVTPDNMQQFASEN
ncbi:MAG: sugar ABC transporter substrate-binding protein [Rhodobacteraceae bacterium]|nr:sugar ABC transporter substrate-binding protein [Paracoccaceae bacterium]